jgi:hypothetical protein
MAVSGDDDRVHPPGGRLGIRDLQRDGKHDAVRLGVDDEPGRADPLHVADHLRGGHAGLHHSRPYRRSDQWQTIDLLFVTPIRPFSIIWGKLLASMSFVLLLLLLSVPIFSLVFLFGGIELDQMLYAFLVVAVTALTFGLIGIAFSSLFRRTLAATVAAYGAALLVLAGSLVYGLLFPVDIDPKASTFPAPPAVTLLSPVLPLVTIATNAPINGYGYRNSFLGGNGGYCTSQPNGGVSCYSTAVSMPAVGTAKGSYVSPTMASPASGTKLPSGFFRGWQYWQASVVMQLVVCLAALAFSAYVLPPIRRFRLRRTPAPAPETA